MWYQINTTNSILDHKNKWNRNQFYYNNFTISISWSFSLNNAAESDVGRADPEFLNSFCSLANSFCNCLTSALSDITTLTCALVATSLAQLANKRVFLVCSTWLRAGLMVQMIAVLALPPNEDCSMRVSFESLKGICPFLPLLQPNSLLLDKSERNVAPRKVYKIFSICQTLMVFIIFQKLKNKK